MARLMAIATFCGLLGTGLVFGQSEDAKSAAIAKFSFLGGELGEERELVPGIRFRLCHGGTFQMGSPASETERDTDEDQISVTVTLFWLGETEVTQGQWQKLMGTTPWKDQVGVKEGRDFPATYVSYDDAVEFAGKLTIQEQTAGRLPKGWKYSLPTEAQWEYACRGRRTRKLSLEGLSFEGDDAKLSESKPTKPSSLGANDTDPSESSTTTRFSFGDNDADLGEYGWFDKNALDVGEKFAHQVALKKPNSLGLYDMHGNAREWCLDWYGEKLPGGRDPQGPSSGGFRVIRGGSWYNYAASCRSAARHRYLPNLRYSYLGFRIAAVRE